MSTRKSYLTKVAIAISISLLLTVLLISNSFAKAEQNRSNQENPYRVEEFTIDTPGELQVRTSGGHITVEGSNTNSVRVEMYVRKDGENLTSSDTDLDKWEIDISQSGNSINAIAKHKNNNGWSSWNNQRPSISFVVYTPKEISSDLKTSGGHIEAKDLKGNQMIATSGGHLTLENLKGTVEAKTSGGHIDLTNLEGDLDVRTSGGHITANTITGTLQAKTSGGHIKLSDINGSVKAATSGGSITATVRSIDQYVDLSTSGGNVDLSIPDGTGADLALRGSFVNGKLNNFSGEMDKHKVKGQLNGGGPKISARTSGGTVSLNFN